MGNCYLENKDNDDWINYCDEKWEKRLKDLGDDAYNLDDINPPILKDGKVESLF